MLALFSIEQHSLEIEKMCYQVIGYPCLLHLEARFGLISQAL